VFYVIYRFCDKSLKTNLFNITKEECLGNFEKIIGLENCLFIADSCSTFFDYFREKYLIQHIPKSNIYITNNGNSGSLKYSFELAFQLKDDDIVYFVEDDFLHHPKASRDLIIEGLEKADYVSLYDHADKYKKGVNPYVDDFGEETKVFLTKSSHWKFTNSTVQTFATRVFTLREDKEILYKYNFRGDKPDSFSTFRDLKEKGRKLATPIPGKATHCHSPWESPLIDWKEVARGCE